MISCTSPRAATTRRYAGSLQHRLQQRTGGLELGHGLEQRGEADPRGGRRAVAAEIDQTGLAGQHHDREHVVDVVGHRDDVGLDHVRPVRVQRRPDRGEQTPATAVGLGGRSTRFEPSSGRRRGHLVRQQRDPRGRGRARRTGWSSSPSRSNSTASAAWCLPLCSRTSRVARPRPIAVAVRISRRMRAVGGQPVAVGQHRVADQGQVGEQLVEAEVVPAGLVRRAVGQPVAGALQPDPDVA